MVKKLKPELHSKTHFKAIESHFIRDSKNMNLGDGSANEIIKQVISARYEKKQKEMEARGSLRTFS